MQPQGTDWVRNSVCQSKNNQRIYVYAHVPRLSQIGNGSTTMTGHVHCQAERVSSEWPGLHHYVKRHIPPNILKQFDCIATDVYSWVICRWKPFHAKLIRRLLCVSRPPGPGHDLYYRSDKGGLWTTKVWPLTMSLNCNMDSKMRHYNKGHNKDTTANYQSLV